MDDLVHSCVLKLTSGCRPKPLQSTFNYQATSLRKPLSQTLLTEYFGDQRRVATRRHRTTPTLPQCTKNPRLMGSTDVAGSKPEWQNFIIPADMHNTFNTTLHARYRTQPLYDSRHRCSYLELVLCGLFLFFTCCSCCSCLSNHWARYSRTKQIHLSCWPG